MTRWLPKIIATTFSLLLILAGITYENAVSRISALEQDRKDLTGVAQAIAIQTERMDERLISLEKGQQSLAAVITENTKDYRDALRRWEIVLERFLAQNPR